MEMLLTCTSTDSFYAYSQSDKDNSMEEGSRFGGPKNHAASAWMIGASQYAKSDQTKCNNAKQGNYQRWTC